MNQDQQQERRKSRQPNNRTPVRNNRGEHSKSGSHAPQRSRNGNRKPIKSQWQKRRRRKKMLRLLRKNAIPLAILFVLAMGILYLAFLGIRFIFSGGEQGYVVKAEKVKLDGEIEKMTMDSPNLDVQLLTVNKYSRPGTKLEKVKGIVIHYVGNPGTTAAQNRSYFESLKDTHKASASSHFVVGIDGEIVQCIPTTEIAYCSNERNKDTVSIECCHEKKDGKFTEETYNSLVHLTAFLCCKYDLEMEDIIRHYDVTGKECPKYYVDHEDKWVQFKKDVAAYIEKNAHVSK